jgi:signal peptidase I
VGTGIRVLLSVVAAVAVLVGGFFLLTHRATVSTNAMEPTLKHGEHVAVFRFQDRFTSPGRKDVVLVKSEPAGPCRTTNVGRVVGRPGEKVEDRKGVLFIDGGLLQEPYVPVARRDTRTQTWRVPADTYLVLGDNRRAPCAVIGLVPRKDVVGTVFLTYWPVDRISVG